MRNHILVTPEGGQSKYIIPLSSIKVVTPANSKSTVAYVTGGHLAVKESVEDIAKYLDGPANTAIHNEWNVKYNREPGVDVA